MKKALLTLAAVAMAGSAFAQGTIQFTNSEMPNSTGGGTYNAPIFQPNGTTPIDSTFTVGLFRASDLATATPITSTTIFGTSGLFLGDEAAVTGAAPGSTVSLVVRAWPTSSGSYANALATQALRGESAAFTSQPLGGQNPAPPPPAFFTPALTGMQSFSLVPEPSTYALGMLGLGALAMMRRRK